MKTPAQLFSAIKQTIEHEIRACGLMHEPEPLLPPPCDVDAEAEVVSALLAGYVRPHELAPLGREHFYSQVLGAIFEATVDVVEPGDLEAVKANLVTMGWRGALDDELKVTAFMQPWASLARVRQLSVLIIELAKQRELLAHIKRVDKGLRIGELDRAGAQRLLSEATA